MNPLPHAAGDTACPGTRTRELALTGRLPREELTSFFAHVVRCEECRALMPGFGPETNPPKTELLGSADAGGGAVPSSLGDYRIVRSLGEGGMGEVYLAEDSALGRQVALKVMKSFAGRHAQLSEWFLAEARALASINHDHVVKVFQVGQDAGLPYFVMELLEGETLADRLRSEGVLEVTEAVRIAREVAEGLEAVHHEGLAHCDLKPGNVWLEPKRRRSADGPGEERAKLLDFGLARRAAGLAEAETDDRELAGTPQYMAPELTTSGAADSRSDLFSLGCVLYEMLTGTVPFPGEGALDTILAIQLDDHPPVTEYRPEVPAGLADVVEWLLERSPEDRPGSAAEVIDLLLPWEAPARKNLTWPLLFDGTVEFGWDDEPEQEPEYPDPAERPATLAGVIVVSCLLTMAILYLLRG